MIEFTASCSEWLQRKRRGTGGAGLCYWCPGQCATEELQVLWALPRQLLSCLQGFCQVLHVHTAGNHSVAPALFTFLRGRSSPPHHPPTKLYSRRTFTFLSFSAGQVNIPSCYSWLVYLLEFQLPRLSSFFARKTFAPSNIHLQSIIAHNRRQLPTGERHSCAEDPTQH